MRVASPDQVAARHARRPIRMFRDSRLHILEKGTTFRMLASTHEPKYASILQLGVYIRPPLLLFWMLWLFKSREKKLLYRLSRILIPPSKFTNSIPDTLELFIQSKYIPYIPIHHIFLHFRTSKWVGIPSTMPLATQPQPQPQSPKPIP